MASNSEDPEYEFMVKKREIDSMVSKLNDTKSAQMAFDAVPARQHSGTVKPTNTIEPISNKPIPKTSMGYDADRSEMRTTESAGTLAEIHIS